METLKLFATTFLNLFAEMAPFLLLGFLLAGILHVWVPQSLYVPKISKPTFKSSLLAALFGIPLPICSCGVIPTAVALRKEGASKGASVSFLISTPATGVDSILATYSLLGLPFAILRPVAAFVSSLFGGLLTNFVTKNEAKEDLSKIVEPECHCCCEHKEHKEHHAEEHCCCHEHDEHKHDEHCCCHEHDEHEHEEHCCCHEHDEHEHDEHCCCHKHDEHEHDEHCCSGHNINEEKCECCCSSSELTGSRTLMQKVADTFSYGFGSLLKEISRWLLIGLVLGALIAAFVPDELFVGLREYPVLCMFAVLLISMPMYTCSTGSIPLALALMDKGLPPGAALVLLMAGPATSIASMVVVGKSFGKRTLFAYLFSIALGAFVFGFIVDHFMMDTFLGTIVAESSEITSECLCWFDYACAAILAALILKGLLPTKKKSNCSCSH